MNEPIEAPETFHTRRTTSNSRGPGQKDMPLDISVDRVTACPKCQSKRSGAGPHSRHWGKAPCGHLAMVDCRNDPVAPCDLCEQKPWPAPSLEHVELRDAGTGITLVCRRCASALAFSRGSVESMIEAFEEKHLFCREAA